MKLIIASRHTVKAARKRCISKFLHYFKKGFQDEKYIGWERQYKLDAHIQFQQKLDAKTFKKLLSVEAYEKIAHIAIQIESKTNLLFSFEKMAIRDAIKSKEGAKQFACGLFQYLYTTGSLQQRFENFVEGIGQLPRKQTRVLTWPLITVFSFLAQPENHIFLKPKVTQRAAEKYKFDFDYISPPNWDTYESLLVFAEQIRSDTKLLRPRDFIDLQSFIWVIGSDEYPE
ncbi:MAG TPA: hypothetical protein VFH07_09930 [Chitinophagaceae bacterium]|nr:hypothetical protein [Chitinophagaceae bacterium]